MATGPIIRVVFALRDDLPKVAAVGPTAGLALTAFKHHDVAVGVLSASQPQVHGLVERERDLELLEAAFAEACSGHGRVVLLTAEAGGGKTALIDRFCADRARPARVLRGACDALFTPRPLGPVHDFAAEAGREVEEMVAGGAIPYQVASALLEDLSGRAPTVLVIEDVHWADEATLDVIKVVTRRIGTAKVLVVLSYRDESVDATHPLRRMLGDVASGLAPTHLCLEPLSAAGVAQIAEPYGMDAGEVFRVTGGNPFFVTEVVRSGNGAIPTTVRDAVHARAAGLTDAARCLLDAVAIDPLHVELWLLEALAGKHVTALEECLASGMLVERSRAVAFRHELARLAIEGSLAPRQRLSLHREALAALAEPPGGSPDLSRLAHHAEAAGDAAAVLEHAPAAAARASTVGAHREAEAQYARALRFAAGAPARVRADLLERFAAESYMTEMRAHVGQALEEARAIHHQLGDAVRESETLRLLSRHLGCIGRPRDARTVADEAIAILEELPPGPELARAYAARAGISMNASEFDEALELGARAIELAERTGDTESLLHALNSVGVVEAARGISEGWAKLERSLELARKADLMIDAGRAYLNLTALALEQDDWLRADSYIARGIDYCRETGMEAWLNCLVAARAESELAQGQWTAAAETAKQILALPVSDIPDYRLSALKALALVRARRGDPEYWPLLDEALELAERSGDLQVIAPVAAARAEALWLEGKPNEVDVVTRAAYERALELRHPAYLGELACWRRRAGLDEPAPSGTAEPFSLLLAGECVRAAERWRNLGAPYDAALALADSNEEEPLRQALEELQRLEARPAAAIVARRLRELGVRDIRRGPRPSTRENVAGLTTRESEILALVAEGLRNGDIATRLFLSPRTVDNHVSAILRKLGTDNRMQAAAKAATLGLSAR